MERENCKITAETTGRRNNDNGIYSSPDPGGTAVAYRYRLAIQVPPQPPPPCPPWHLPCRAPCRVSGRWEEEHTQRVSGAEWRGEGSQFLSSFLLLLQSLPRQFQAMGLSQSPHPDRSRKAVGGMRHAGERTLMASLSPHAFFFPPLFWAFFFRIPFLSRACQSRGRHCLFMPSAKGDCAAVEPLWTSPHETWCVCVCVPLGFSHEMG